MKNNAQIKNLLTTSEEGGEASFEQAFKEGHNVLETSYALETM